MAEPSSSAISQIDQFNQSQKYIVVADTNSNGEIDKDDLALATSDFNELGSENLKRGDPVKFDNELYTMLRLIIDPTFQNTLKEKQFSVEIPYDLDVFSHDGCKGTDTFIPDDPILISFVIMENGYVIIEGLDSSVGSPDRYILSPNDQALYSVYNNSISKSDTKPVYYLDHFVDESLQSCFNQVYADNNKLTQERKDAVQAFFNSAMQLENPRFCSYPPAGIPW